jgi:hypothetical protein
MRISLFLNLWLVVLLLIHYSVTYFGGYIYNGKKPSTAENLLLKLNCISLEQFCFIIRQFIVIVITEAVCWKEKIAISVKLHLQGGYNFCVAVTYNVNHRLLPFLRAPCISRYLL